MNNETSGMMAARPGAGPSTGGGGAGVSVGNYKGVMLCNRPFAGIVASHGQGNSRVMQNAGEKMPPFLPSGPHQNERAGLNPIRTRPFVLDVLSKEKKDSVNNKHRRFIKKLQQEKRKEKEEGMEEEKQRETKLAQFREKQRQMRQKVVAIMQQRVVRGGGGGNETDCVEEKSPERRDSSKNPQTESENADNDEMQAELECTFGGASSKQARGGAGNSKKPMWAMTSDAAEEKEEQEVEDLVSFARSLDFEEFLSDLEVKTAMAAMQKRIRSLKRSHKIRDESKYVDDGDDDEDASLEVEGRYGVDDVLGGISQEFLELVQGRKASIAGKSEGSDRESEASEARDTVGTDLRSAVVHRLSGSGDDVSVADAKSIMSTVSVQSMRSVHSTRSITKLAKDALKRIDAEEKAQQQQQGGNADGVAPSQRVEIVLAPPRIVDIVEDGGTRLSKKSDVSNLPYMHRNPAI